MGITLHLQPHVLYAHPFQTALLVTKAIASAKHVYLDTIYPQIRNLAYPALQALHNAQFATHLKSVPPAILVTTSHLQRFASPANSILRTAINVVLQTTKFLSMINASVNLDLCLQLIILALHSFIQTLYHLIFQ
jgi:hypothetical protein